MLARYPNLCARNLTSAITIKGR